MRLSCNGCRVLRKGCNLECPIKPCLNWIKSPESQSNATLFLAKFYGRAGLLNLLTAGDPKIRPAIFKSLLYEACGRIVNPVFGSTGLLSTGSWHLCEAAVEAVLSGAPIRQQDASDGGGQLLNPSDIRHVVKRGKSCSSDHVLKPRKSQFKRRAEKSKPEPEPEVELDQGVAELVVEACVVNELDDSASPDSGSGLSEHVSVVVGGGAEADSGSIESVNPARADDGELELELTLGCQWL
ncbi:hypothetical protein HN51_008740 [Arachis hypogaea]|uniref:LOB domain-containing protein n=1 Tax=Arachis hypogaea TaxID=3818 RepID=A0A445D2Q9_ARAHY|nr:LOB domain-containing protein 41 [Arachis hypogaea]QHO43084.1 LOB domain-containing protein [Arachis hypogaea]RYR57310.1 hypothetical protein Ahy_A05g023036 [Arachis hypogaea]